MAMSPDEIERRIGELQRDIRERVTKEIYNGHCKSAGERTNENKLDLQKLVDRVDRMEDDTNRRFRSVVAAVVFAVICPMSVGIALAIFNLALPGGK